MGNKSFKAIRDFSVSQCHSDDFRGKCDVIVDNYLYNSIYVAVYYQVQYMDFRVEINWEEDSSQPDYTIIGLHGYYSTNFTDFSFDNNSNTLRFRDGNHNVMIHPL